MGPKPGSDMKMNAIRSGIVVLGALAFGYLSIQIGFKPYLEKAQNQNALYESDPSLRKNHLQLSQNALRDNTLFGLREKEGFFCCPSCVLVIN
ncbi:LOW QUALITY PROTEIN: uncharacterized protein [Glycine max]|uniref:LOW QUALITY PROTEIN: uncharacterized protein n=1 Tax=Glycine max TaxID=3847 RepID=UPI001B356829|nr:LOW QUALITY PROTEIN: uncharacterized protein LOC100527685 [Glycine max]